MPTSSDEGLHAASANNTTAPKEEEVEVISWLTLRFPSEPANKLFYEEQILSQLATQDRCMCFFSGCFLLLIAILTLHWTLVQLAFMVLVIACSCCVYFLSSMRTERVMLLYFHHRSAVILVWRFSRIILAQIFHVTRVFSPGYVETRSFPVHLLVNSAAVVLSTLTIGSMLPFWLHVITVPPMMLVIWTPGTVSTSATSICKYYPESVKLAHLWITRATTIPGLGAGDMGGVGGCQDFKSLHAGQVVLSVVGGGQCVMQDSDVYCPGAQLLLFVQLSIGIVLPTVLLYRMEWRARLHFLQAHAEDYTPSSMRVRTATVLLQTSQCWVVRVTELAQLYLSLAMLWHALDMRQV